MGKAFEKQTKTIEDQWQKRVEVFNTLKPNNQLTIEDVIRKTKESRKKEEKEIALENLYNFFEGREKILDAFESKIFLTKSKGAGILNPDHSKLKILTHKQMLQRLPIALAQVKAGNNTESLLNEIRKIVYSLYQSKQITKKVYNNIIKSI